MALAILAYHRMEIDAGAFAWVSVISLCHCVRNDLEVETSNEPPVLNLSRLLPTSITLAADEVGGAAWRIYTGQPNPEELAFLA